MEDNEQIIFSVYYVFTYLAKNWIYFGWDKYDLHIVNKVHGPMVALICWKSQNSADLSGVVLVLFMEIPLISNLNPTLNKITKLQTFVFAAYLCQK